MAGFEIKEFGEGWLLTPTSHASRAWCQSNLADEFWKSGDSYVMEQQLMLQIIDQFMERKSNWFGF